MTLIVEVKLLSVPLGLLSYRTSFMSKYQVLCYCSLAKPDPHTKSKTLVSQDRYGIVFMHGQNVMADISAQFQLWFLSVHLNPRSLLGLTTLVAT